MRGLGRVVADFLNECLSDPALSAYAEQGPEEFAKHMCRACRNTDCDRNNVHNKDVNPWVDRMATQEDRLLINPKFANPADPEFAPIRKVDFRSAFREAISLEIAAKKGDWNIPSGTDAVEYMSSTDPKPPDRLVDEVHVIPDPSQAKPTPLPQRDPSSGNVPTKMEVAKSGRSKCRYCHEPIPNGAKRFGRYTFDDRAGKAIWTWYHPTCGQTQYPEEMAALGEVAPEPVAAAPPTAPPVRFQPEPTPPAAPEPAPAPRPPTPPVPVSRTPEAVVGPERRTFSPSSVNTPMPQGGITLGGGPPQAAPSTPTAPTPPQQHDPWAVPAPKGRVVKAGATVQMGGGKKKDG
jgi:hypothetical protein